VRRFQGAIGSRGCGILDTNSQFLSAVDGALDEAGGDISQVAANLGCVLDCDFGGITDRSHGLRFAAQNAHHHRFGGKNSIFYCFHHRRGFGVYALSVLILVLQFVDPLLCLILLFEDRCSPFTLF
jgi:hypothetical protein